MSCAICFRPAASNIKHNLAEKQGSKTTISHRIHPICLARWAETHSPESTEPIKCPVCVTQITHIQSEGTTYRVSTFVKKIIHLEKELTKTWETRIKQAVSQKNWTEIRTLLNAAPGNLDSSFEALFCSIFEEAINRPYLKILPLLFKFNIIPPSVLGIQLVAACQKSNPKLAKYILSSKTEIPESLLSEAALFARKNLWQTALAILHFSQNSLSIEARKQLILEAVRRNDQATISYILTKEDIPKEFVEKAQQTHRSRPASLELQYFQKRLDAEVGALKPSPSLSSSSSPAKDDELARLLIHFSWLGMSLLFSQRRSESLGSESNPESFAPTPLARCTKPKFVSIAGIEPQASASVSVSPLPALIADDDAAG